MTIFPSFKKRRARSMLDRCAPDELDISSHRSLCVHDISLLRHHPFPKKQEAKSAATPPPVIQNKHGEEAQGLTKSQSSHTSHPSRSSTALWIAASESEFYKDANNNEEEDESNTIQEDLLNTGVDEACSIAVDSIRDNKAAVLAAVIKDDDPAASPIDEKEQTDKENNPASSNNSSCHSTRSTTSTAAAIETTPKQRRSVAFSTVQFREYPMRVGDNPAVTRGVPITIDWEHVCEYQIGVDAFEADRPPRRFQLELKMESLDRVRLLKRLGYSTMDIKEGIRQANVARDRRQRTRDLLPMAHVLQDMIGRMKRMATNATIRRAAKKRERKLLNAYRKGGGVASLSFHKDDSVYTQLTEAEHSTHSAISYPQ